MVSSSASSSTPSPPNSRMSSPSRETLDGITSSLEAARAALSVVHAHEGVRALIPTKTRTYLAPGGDYSFLNFTHEYGCRNALAPEFDDRVRRAIVTAAPATTKEVEVTVRGFLMGKDCSATCGLDKDSTTRLFLRYNSDGGSQYTPSSDLPPPTDSQAIVPESPATTAQAPPTIPTVGSSDWPESEPTRPHPSATHAPRPIRASRAPGPPRLSEASSSAASIFKDMSSGERRIYGKKFDLDRESDEDYAPPATGSRIRARSESPRKRSAAPVRAGPMFPFQRAIDIDEGRKKLIVPFELGLPLEEHRKRIAPPAREPSPIESTPAEPDTTMSRPDTPPILATEDVLPSSEVMVQDTPMALGDGKNTDATGLGDSKHAPSSVPPGFELASSPPCFPPTSPSGWIDGLSEGVPGTQPTPDTPMEVPLPDTQPEDTEAFLARMDEIMAENNAFLAERGLSSS